MRGFSRIHAAVMTGIAGALFAGSPAANALPTIDGTRDGEYGPALAVQTVQTQFGDENGGNNGSELDAAYARIEGGKLFLMLTGNVQNNFNKLEIFIDSKAGGQSVFDSSGNDFADRMDGLVFDAGFTADYHLIARRGSAKFDLDFANLGAQTASAYFDVFGGQDFGSGTTGTGVNAVGIAAAYNGSNTAGVTGGTGPADQTAAAAVTTGVELAIDLADLGYTSGPINIMVGQNGDGHHFWSNQFLGGLPTGLNNGPGSGGGTGNLGGDGNGNFTGEGAIDFAAIPGNQFFTVVPEPASLGLLALGSLALARRRVRTH